MSKLLLSKLLFIFDAAVLLQGAVTVEQHHPHDFSFRASVTGNPFDAVIEGEFTGPDAVRLRVPGFYDGDGVWKIRFSATLTGEWTMRTTSPIGALNGRTEQITAVANKNKFVHGVLQVDPEHPYHFRFPDGARFFPMGYEADWLWGADMLDPSRKLMHRLIDQIHGRGFNWVLVNVYAHDTRWCPGRVNEHDYGPPALYAWEGANDKPDHSRLNPRFFQIYDGMMRALLDKGMIAHIMLKVYNKQVNWPAKGSRDEERYFRYVTARYQAFPNLVWDFSKESFNERDNDLQKNLLDLVRMTDAYKHLVTAHDDDDYEWDPNLSRNLDFRTDQQHSHWAEMIAFDRALRRRPVVNAEFSYELGVEPLPKHTNRNQVGWQEMIRRAYLITMAGGYVAYYYNNTAWDIVKPDPEPPGHRRWQLLKEIMTSVPYWRMNPEPQLAAGGPCLVERGRHYLCYVEGPNLALNLTALTGRATGEWVNTWTGERVPTDPFTARIIRLPRPKPFGDAPAVLVVRQGP
jgi:hypothetical protein